MRTPMLTPIVRTLIVINVIVFMVQSFNSHYDDQITSLFGLHYFTSERFNPIQFVSYMFVHGGFMHLFSNMLGLFFMGPLLERYWGEKRFLAFYFITGIGAGLLYMGVKYYDYSVLEEATRAYILHPDLSMFNKFLEQFYPSGIPSEAYSYVPSSGRITLQDSIIIAEESLRAVLNTPTVGASGATFGVMAGFAMLFPNTELIVFPIPIPIKAKYLVALYALYEFYGGIHKTPGDNVAHFAHIGGMIFAFILIKLWSKNRNNFY
ncbi:rhomboid family intramembrane serine protease [Flectobacillus sp. DC10W]|uniref:Rhomboid family intramembrane serine protease n=2 Tax=Flectobacillus longus TaxID=2984207 RepID=A0ABT6YPK5_9BACT|nr:rhomboid family intramembrane serine protease [Flectobacillus longus]MDI9865359.1 rhomboid family intramembrane serine protease [Flectobacillus longus]